MQDRQPPHTARVWGFGGIMKFSDYAKLKMKNIILRESLLSKSDYERRERNLRICNAENAEILTNQGFEKEQIDAIEQVCYIRHELHTHGAKTLWATESSNFSTYYNWLDGGIWEILNDAGIKNNLKFYDVEDLPCDNDFEWLDDDEIGDHDEYYENALNEISDFLIDVNNKIENWLRDFDKKYGTHYAPTGAWRM